MEKLNISLYDYQNELFKEGNHMSLNDIMIVMKQTMYGALTIHVSFSFLIII